MAGCAVELRRLHRQVAVDHERTGVPRDRVQRHRPGQRNGGGPALGAVGQRARAAGGQAEDLAGVVGGDREAACRGLDHEVLERHARERDVGIAHEGVGGGVDDVVAQRAGEGHGVVALRRTAALAAGVALGLGEGQAAGGGDDAVLVVGTHVQRVSGHDGVGQRSLGHVADEVDRRRGGDGHARAGLLLLVGLFLLVLVRRGVGGRAGHREGVDAAGHAGAGGDGALDVDRRDALQRRTRSITKARDVVAGAEHEGAADHIASAVRDVIDRSDLVQRRTVVDAEQRADMEAVALPAQPGTADRVGPCGGELHIAQDVGLIVIEFANHRARLAVGVVDRHGHTGTDGLALGHAAGPVDLGLQTAGIDVDAPAVDVGAGVDVGQGVAVLLEEGEGAAYGELAGVGAGLREGQAHDGFFGLDVQAGLRAAVEVDT